LHQLAQPHFHAMTRALRVCLLTLAALACSRQRCKEAGCAAGTRITYQSNVSAAYDLQVRTAGLVLSAHCPQDARSATPVGPNSATLICDGSGFMVATANASNGAATAYGDNPVDAKALDFNVELKRLGAPVIQRTVTAALTNVERPNGPDCPSVCYGRQGTMNFEQ
jgi:hypothetical protein